MKLSEYLRDHGTSAAAFGREAGLGSRQLIHKYLSGERFPTPENLRRIREATGGAVTADDFVDQHTAPAPEPTPTTEQAA